MFLWLMPVFLLIGFPAHATDIVTLADCATKVFKEINKSQKWSGKAPAGCSAKIAVERRPTGLFVISWDVTEAEGGWIKTAFSAGMGYDELDRGRKLADANHDIMARAVRIRRCLDSINSVNDPLECRDHATRSYSAGEESGTENKRLIWLDDNGRHTVAEYSYGTTRATPSPPADLMGGQTLPPGIIIDLHLRGQGAGVPGTPAGPATGNGSRAGGGTTGN
jgi:hypothetical protein